MTRSLCHSQVRSLLTGVATSLSEMSSSSTTTTSSSSSWLNVFFGLLLVVLFSLNSSEGVVDAQELPSGFLQLTYSVDSGAFTITINGTTWLTSGDVWLHADEQYFSVKDGTLKLTEVLESDGSDFFGSYESVSFLWSGLLSDDSNFTFTTTLRTYPTDLPNIIVFSQAIDVSSGLLTGTSLNINTDTISSFPSFDLDFQPITRTGNGLRYMSYFGNMAEPGYGIWGPSMRDPWNVNIDNSYYGGFLGQVQGGTPLVLFDDSNNVAVLSSLGNFMIGLQGVSPHSNDFVVGLQGMLTSVPTPFVHQSILVAGGNGVSNAVQTWGELLRNHKGKKPRGLQADVASTYLGYWTDNGAYYYYVTEPNKNYAQTMADVKSYIDSIGLPVQYYQFDSWWYFKGENDGVKLWEPMSTVFPEGMGPVDQSIGNTPLTLHNRYFSPDNDYISNYTFIVEPDYALPLDEDMFFYIMSKARGWGLETYEQDWLVTVYQGMNATQNNVTNARNWMLALNNGAQRAGLTVQMCMPLPMHLLQSLEMPTVTQARASNDYQPGNSQWRIASTSLLHWSLGILPFKDNFFSSSDNQSGCNSNYYECQEPNSELQTLVATLTAGPVGPSDMIGLLNVSRIMQTCRADGMLLKADRPVFPLQLAFQSQFNRNTSWLDDLWHTTTALPSSSSSTTYSWHYILGVNTTVPYTIYPSDLLVSGFDAPTPTSGLVFNYYDLLSAWRDNNWLDGPLSSYLITPFDATNPLTIAPLSTPHSPMHFEYWIAAPTFENGWTLLGEAGKFISVSSFRVADIDASSPITTDSLLLALVGGNSEAVRLILVPPNTQTPFVFTTSLDSGGQGKVLCSSNGQCQTLNNLDFV